MSSINLIPIFMIGLLGGVHCVGMCGGIVGAFSAASVPRRNFPIAAASTPTAALKMSALEGALRVVAYNVGRLSSYALAGAIAGGIAGGTRTLMNLSAFQVGGYWLANLMLIALGLYLMDAWRGLVRLEKAGQGIWRHVQPLMKHLLPLDSPLKALALGGLWGWLPCGMVYSILLTALLSGSAGSGALVMLAFGLGTLPTLLTLGLFGAQWKNWAQRRRVRVTGGLIVLAFGALGLVRAAYGVTHDVSPAWLDAVCVSPSIAGPSR